ncbi:MAG TPA: pentapeptide repeat-containing protein [Leptolyngbyaceae cyanobacterium M65_K2018_010]|nr:pentapeptide repeat-containing protein [Leptolyngbyaceae cyanobacterium M65_K2018_010]
MTDWPDPAPLPPDGPQPLTPGPAAGLSGLGGLRLAEEGGHPTSPSPYAPADTTVAPASAITLVAVAVIFLGLIVDSVWLILAGSLVATVVSLRLMWPFFQEVLAELSPRQQALAIAIPSILIGILGLMQITGLTQAILAWGLTLPWEVLGALGDFLGALGQIFIAFLALFVAWRQYVISRDLTLQQNLITQQQTIDAYFQGISELVLDEEGLLEDWPQERIIAEARTAAILSSVDANGKAKVIRFLSRSRLLTPLRRDNRLGRAILDGRGGYEEDWPHGTRVIDLGAMLAVANLAGTDLRWADLSEANLIRANLKNCDLVKANFTRTILYEANLAGADLMGVRLFFGDAKTASPRTRNGIPDYATGAHTGAVIEGANLTGVQRLSEDQRWYCCAWGGSATRATVPGGCGDIPNLLGR